MLRMLGMEVVREKEAGPSTAPLAVRLQEASLRVTDLFLVEEDNNIAG